MNIAVASGKGGTGKTTVAACLAANWDGPVTAVDLDVEEPTCTFFSNRKSWAGKQPKWKCRSATNPVKEKLSRMLDTSEGDVIIDAPPGVSCPAVNAVMDSDVVILVTEPTPFGLHDLKLAVEAFTPFTEHVGVVVISGKGGTGKTSLTGAFSYLAKLPFDEHAIEAVVQGRVITEYPDAPLSKLLCQAWADIVGLVSLKNAA